MGSSIKWYEPIPRVYEPRKNFGMMATDWQERVNFDRLRSQRLEKAKEQMKKHGLEAVLLFNGENIRYVTGTWDYGWRSAAFFLRYCVLPIDADPILFDTAGCDIAWTRQNAPWLKDLRPAIIWKGAGPGSLPFAKRMAEGVKKTLQEYGVKGRRLGLDMSDPYAHRALTETGLEIVDGHEALRDARLIKTPDELEILKQACAVVDAAFYMAKHVWGKPGLTPKQLAGKVIDFVLSSGFDAANSGASCGGEQNPQLRAATDRIIRQGDWISMDNVCQLNGYWTDYVRCWLCEAKPTAEQKRVYKEAYDAMYATINACKPGATTADVARQLNVDDYFNIDERDGTRTLMGLLHSVGLRHHEDFEISRATSIEFPEEVKENMYFACETYVASPNGVDAVRLEENFVVTPYGPKVFSLAPLEEDMLEE